MTKIEFKTRAAEVGWMHYHQPDHFIRGNQQAVIWDDGPIATRVTVLERKTLPGRRSGRVISQLAEVWSGTAEAFLKLQEGV